MKTVTVDTPGGRLRGRARASGLYFGGIPFARPPTGELRFAPPLPPEPWTGVRDAVGPGPAAPQLAVTRLGPISQISRLVRGPMSEDSLTLNVSTPAIDADRRPVLVWLHGGAFVLGAGSTFLYDAESLTSKGNVVVVSLNYRLGALGFLNLSDLSSRANAPSNLGIRDQIAALEWIRDNIGAFGGDPENVTVFGESAGAMSLGVLVATAPSLFRRAILESGACANVSTRNEAAYIAERFLDTVGLTADDLEGLRSLPVATLLRAQRSALAGDSGKMGRLPWQPAVDGDLLPQHPLTMIGQSGVVPLEVIIGTNRDEWKLFTSASIALRAMSFDELERRVGRLLERSGRSGKSAAAATEIYREITRVRGCRRTAYEAWVACRSDEYFRMPAIELAEALTRAGSNCYMYRFDYPIPAFRQALGACHAAEVPLVFGTQRTRWLRPLYLASKKADRLSEVIQEAWLAFASSGVPSDSELSAWSLYEAAGRSTRILGAAGASEPILMDPEADARRFWLDL
ncbi:MAG: carboxylesterase/lipase family protein [bacterium]|nr:carboxylesterase/lipase family protein [bacterium]